MPWPRQARLGSRLFCVGVHQFDGQGCGIAATQGPCCMSGLGVIAFVMCFSSSCVRMPYIVYYSRDIYWSVVFWVLWVLLLVNQNYPRAEPGREYAVFPP